MRRSRYNWECSNRRKECYSSKGQGSRGQVSAVKDDLISFDSLIEPGQGSNHSRKGTNSNRKWQFDRRGRHYKKFKWRNSLCWKWKYIWSSISIWRWLISHDSRDSLEMTFDLLLSGKQIGDRNIFEVRSRLQGDITVQNGCVFGSKTVYTQPGAIPDKTVIYTQVSRDQWL